MQVGTIDVGNPNSSCKKNGALLEVNPDCNITTVGEVAKRSLEELFLSSCAGQRSCTIDLNAITWPSNCDTTVTAFVKAE